MVDQLSEKQLQDRLALTNPRSFTDPDIANKIFEKLRKEDPVAWCPQKHTSGFWAITRYDDIEYISKHPNLFSSKRELGGVNIDSPEEIMARLQAEGISESGSIPSDFQGTSIITMDPPIHTKKRRVVAPGFTPQRLDKLEIEVTARVCELLDSVAATPECDFVPAVAAELPIQILAELFGIPQEDRHKLFHWSNTIMGAEDPDVVSSSDELMNAYRELGQYGLKIAEERKKNPGNDLITMLVQPNADGEVMDTADYLSALLLLVVAGNETTRNAISGGILALSQHPEQKQKLLDNPELIPQAVDEILRWVTPVTYMRRTALEDTELGGKTIKKGDKVVMWYISANRDESKFSNPFTFDITRNETRHISFGYGQHLCIGWRLAEIQLKILLRALLERFPDIEVTGEVSRVRTNLLNSIRTMPVRLVPELVPQEA